MEAVTESFLVFYVFITLPPEITVILMCGVFSTHSLFQAVSNVYSYCKRVNNRDYSPIGHDSDNLLLQYEKRHHCLVNFVMICGLLCQILGLSFVMGFLMKVYFDSRILGLSLVIPCLLILSISWSNLVQKFTFKPDKKSLKKVLKRKKSCKSHQKDDDDKTIITARWKSSKKCVQVNVCDWYVKFFKFLNIFIFIVHRYFIICLLVSCPLL